MNDLNEADIQRAERVARGESQYEGAGTGQEKTKPIPKRRTTRPDTEVINAEELNQMHFDPIKYVVPGYIVEGLTLFAGKPKIGKSWLLLHAAWAVADGNYTLGNVHCEQGDVLYCALEDNRRRLSPDIELLTDGRVSVRNQLSTTADLRQIGIQDDQIKRLSCCW
jgi:predicted ATP-dependent serine protease